MTGMPRFTNRHRSLVVQMRYPVMTKTVEWTYREPTVPGFYWYRIVPDEEPSGLKVWYQDGVLVVVPPGHRLPIPVTEVGGEWAPEATSPD